MAGEVTKLGWFKNQIAELSSESKKIMVYMVGASPAESPDIPLAMERTFSGEEWKGVKNFYCPGGLRLTTLQKLRVVILIFKLNSMEFAE